jgi:cytosine/adenosine deaminase-related metal-dependent hydrolase
VVAAVESAAVWRHGTRGPREDSGVRIGLGSDWSPSGSKNLLGELKVAFLVSESRPRPLFSARELVALATRNGADILKWSHVLGSLEAGKRADLLVVRRHEGDPYEGLIKAKESAFLW